jgi:hypothetical protein
MATFHDPTFERRDPFTDYEARARYERTRYQGHATGDGERSVSSLIGELAGETTALIRAEVALARKEMQDNLGTAQRGVKAMGAGAGVLTAGLLSLVAAAILALALVVPNWLAAVIVGGVLAIAGAIMIGAGKHKTSADGLKPGRTLGSLNEMKIMAQQEQDRAMRKWR